MSLQIQELEKSFGPRKIFSRVSFSVNPGEKTALVGGNGSGKTTLMRLILGEETPDSGRVISPGDARIAYLPQQIFLEVDEAWQLEKSSLTLWDLVIQAFEKLHRIRAEIKSLEDQMSQGTISTALQEKYDLLTLKFEDSGGFTWQARATRLLKGLGFPETRFHDPMETFSGGWQMRGYFARLLLSDPDYLLLDEPTNYLDIASIKFLEEYLSDFPGAILVVSHDRYFLDRLATSVVALMPEGARTFRGNYSEFLEAHQAWIEEQAAARMRQDKERKRIERFVDRFRYKASKASQVQSRIKMLDKMSEIERIRSSKKLSFNFPDCIESGEVVLKLEGLKKSFGSNQVLRGIEFSVNKGDRLAVLGDNGAGKTTLMRIIAGEDLDYNGKMDWGYRVAHGFFAQDEEISFAQDETIWDRMLREAPMDAVANLRNLLGAFLFSGDDIDKPVRVLSGGEKSRLGLARLMLRPCNVLLLDEPTNHLDISSREALLSALDEFPGTIIIVSHDRFFIDCLATKVVMLQNGGCEVYPGNYSQYMWSRGASTRSVVDITGGAGQTACAAADTTDGKNGWEQRKRQQNQRQKWERELSRVEEEVSSLEAEIERLERLLSEPPETMTRDALTDLSRLHAEARQELDATMRCWEQLGSLLTSDEQSETSALEVD